MYEGQIVPYLVKARGPDMSASDALDHPYSKYAVMLRGSIHDLGRYFMKVNKSYPLI
jgi:hypothetical protein